MDGRLNASFMQKHHERVNASMKSSVRWFTRSTRRSVPCMMYYRGAIADVGDR
uniref:Uncharacterized protein n=1 Tax=Hyaloperonospora arabidopsidis (strain Emoy2) TaxID=559515 RepID=M4C125_HYAAE